MIVDVKGLQAIVDRCIYKDWKISVMDVDPYGRVQVSACGLFPERDNWLYKEQAPTTVRSITKGFQVEFPIEEEEFIERLWNNIWNIELHESRECFYVFEKRVKDPHENL